MPVRYIYKNHKPVAKMWTEKTDIGTIFIIGAGVLTIIAAGVAWWKIDRG